MSYSPPWPKAAEELALHNGIRAPEVVAVLQARMSSRRLPGKVLAPILGKPMLWWEIRRICQAKRLDRLVLATSTEPEDDAIVAAGLWPEVYRGSSADVLDRVWCAARGAGHVVRLTGDCPLIDPQIIDRVIDLHLATGADYTSNTLTRTFADGLDVEVMTWAALDAAHAEATDLYEREHVTPFIYRRPERFTLRCFMNGKDESALRWTVDTAEDLEGVRGIYRRGLLTRAERTIPLGAQTFSKSRLQWGSDGPLFADRALGSRLWDVGGNEYIDFVSALCAVNLGYNDPDVTEAVRGQLENGVAFSLSTELEAEVAELICEMVPCAEMVRFGKNGSDATAGAIRAARAFTGREHVAMCGYHGWQDWCIGTRNPNGVPQAVRDLTHVFPYGDLNSLAAILASAACAAVIMEPMATVWPPRGYLEAVKGLAHRHGALLIFDETITGFRFANGGAQELFGVTPDLATFGKGLANGFPLSAVAGRRDIMQLFAGDIFFSFTAGGEALSLAAAKATLLKLRREPVCKRLADLGERLTGGVRERLQKHCVGAFIHLHGHPARSLLNITESVGLGDRGPALYRQEVVKRGVLTFGCHNINYAHSEADVDRLLAVYDEVFPLMLDELSRGQTTPAKRIAAG